MYVRQQSVSSACQFKVTLGGAVATIQLNMIELDEMRRDSTSPRACFGLVLSLPDTLRSHLQLSNVKQLENDLKELLLVARVAEEVNLASFHPPSSSGETSSLSSGRECFVCMLLPLLMLMSLGGTRSH